jgi:hypothetical protein
MTPADPGRLLIKNLTESYALLVVERATAQHTHGPPGVGPAGRFRAGRRAIDWLRPMVPTVVLYLCLRIVAMTVVGRIAGAHHVHHPNRLLHTWDGLWYLGIAENGYHMHTVVASDHRVLTPYAFFPLYPMLIRWIAWLTPLSLVRSGLIISWIASAFAAAGMYKICAKVYDGRVGMILAGLWGVLPHAVYEQAVYTESLFTALAAWALYALLCRRWLAAGLICVAAGLTRPTAAPVIVTVCVAAGLAAYRREDRWRPYAAMALAPAGMVGYLIWVADQMHRWDGYLWTQQQWTTVFDAGRYNWQHWIAIVSGRDAIWDPVYPHAHLQSPGFQITSLIIFGTVALLVLSFLQRQPWPLLMYSALMVVFVLGTAGFYASKPRHMLPDFALLLPMALLLRNTRRSTLIVGLVSLAIMSGWYAGYLLMTWHAPP